MTIMTNRNKERAAKKQHAMYVQALRERVLNERLKPKLLAAAIQTMFRNGLPQGWNK